MPILKGGNRIHLEYHPELNAQLAINNCIGEVMVGGDEGWKSSPINGNVRSMGCCRLPGSVVRSFDGVVN